MPYPSSADCDRRCCLSDAVAFEVSSSACGRVTVSDKFSLRRNEAHHMPCRTIIIEIRLGSIYPDNLPMHCTDKARIGSLVVRWWSLRTVWATSPSAIRRLYGHTLRVRAHMRRCPSGRLWPQLMFFSPRIMEAIIKVPLLHGPTRHLHRGSSERPQDRHIPSHPR